MAPSSSRRASPSDPTAEKAIITSSTSSSSETTPLIGIQNDDTTTDVECGKLPAPRPHSISEDVLDTLKLGVPIFVAMLSWVGMKSTDTALLGHVGSDALSAAALSDLWTMCTAMLVAGRSVDILVGGAVGAGNPKLAGVYLQVSYLVLSFVAVLVVICWNLTEYIWVGFGSDPVIAKMAGYYSSVLSLSIPGQLLFSQLSQFFSAQRIMYPEVNASTLALLCNLVFGLIFVLGIPFPDWYGFGFEACPVVTTACVYIQIFSMWYISIHRQRLHEKAWDGWSYADMTWQRIKTFSNLYFPAALGIASDFWRVAVIGTMAARLGEVEVAVFNTSYRIMWIVLVVVIALSSAAGISMTQRLGGLDHVGAKQAGHVGVSMSTLVCLAIGFLVWLNVRSFGRIFTNDEEFLELFEEARTPFTVTLVLMNVSIALERIPYSMGRTTEVFWMGLIASWGAQVPAVFTCTQYWRHDLLGLYTGMAIGYAVLTILYGALTFTSDWKKYAQLAYQRSQSIDS